MHLGPSTSELYSNFTHPLRFNVCIHSIRSTNTWHRCLLSTTRQFTKLSILKLCRLRFLPAIQRKTCCSWTKQTIEGISLTAVHQKTKKLVIYQNKNVTFGMMQVSKGGDTLESLIRFLFWSVGSCARTSTSTCHLANCKYLQWATLHVDEHTVTEKTYLCEKNSFWPL